MPRTKKYNKNVSSTRRVRRGGGLMNLIRGKKQKLNDKAKLDLVILALGGIEEVRRRARANEKKMEEAAEMKNEVQNPLVDDRLKPPLPSSTDEKRTPPPPPALPPAAAAAADQPAPSTGSSTGPFTGPSTGPPTGASTELATGGKATRKRKNLK